MKGLPVTLYFLGLVPPPPLLVELMAMKRDFAERYHTKAALNSPPHITMVAPFGWPSIDENSIIRASQQFRSANVMKPFAIDLCDYGCFKPRVLFIQVTKNKCLEQLQDKLQSFCRATLGLASDERPFHPHLTLAFRDLKREAFYRAWEEIKDQPFSVSFRVDRFVLMKHAEKHWEIFRTFEFKAS